MLWNENACKFCREAIGAVAYRQAGHPNPHSVSPQSIGNTRKARHVNPIGQTETRTTKGHSAQVRNLHVNNRRLWCNFSEVPGELLTGPGQVVRSYDLPAPHVRPRGCVDRRLRRLLRSIPAPGPAKPIRDSTVVPLSSRCLPGELPWAQAPGLTNWIKLRKDRRTLVNTSKST
jgi:hypothetical protein